MALKDDLAKVVRNILPDAVGMILLILVISASQFVLEFSLGEEWRFFDLIPLRYVADIGPLAIIAKFLWNVLRTPWH